VCRPFFESPPAALVRPSTLGKFYDPGEDHFEPGTSGGGRYKARRAEQIFEVLPLASRATQVPVGQSALRSYNSELNPHPVPNYPRPRKNVLLSTTQHNNMLELPPSNGHGFHPGPCGQQAHKTARVHNQNGTRHNFLTFPLFGPNAPAVLVDDALTIARPLPPGAFRILWRWRRGTQRRTSCRPYLNVQSRMPLSRTKITWLAVLAITNKP